MMLMRHINYTDSTRAERTASEWLPVGANIGDLVNRWASRSDLAVFIGEGATGGLAPALFRPLTAEIEVNTGLAFDSATAEQVGDLRERSQQYEFPKATGMICHEAMHARITQFDLAQVHKDLEKDEASALLLLEESRIEAHGILIDPSHRPFLRASALEVVIGDLSNVEDSIATGKVAAAAQLMALVGGRVVAGVLDRSDVSTVLELVEEELGADNYKRMTEILAEYQNHDLHHNIEPMYPLAKEWAKIVRDLREERGEEGEGEDGESGEGGDSTFGDFMDAVMDALTDAADGVSISNSRDLEDQQQAEEWREEAKERSNAAKERQNHKTVSERIFSKDTAEGERCKTGSTLESERAPRPDERAAAVTVARMLEKAKYRERDVTVVNTAIPAGRLRPRALVQAAAQRAAGRVPDVEPWRKKVRKQTDEPTLTVGVMVDISGSMSTAMEPMATTAWVMSEAVRRVQGRAAMVYYGSDVFPTLKAGQHLDRVRVYSAPDFTEKFELAFQALDGSLNLLNGNGARLLVIVSDGCYTIAERENAKKWMKRCQQAGVGVLWLTFDGYGENAKDNCKGTDAVIISDRMNPAKAAAQIGKAAAKALELVGQRNG